MYWQAAKKIGTGFFSFFPLKELFSFVGGHWVPGLSELRCCRQSNLISDKVRQSIHNGLTTNHDVSTSWLWWKKMISDWKNYYWWEKSLVWECCSIAFVEVLPLLFKWLSGVQIFIEKKVHIQRAKVTENKRICRLSSISPSKCKCKLRSQNNC